jgi:dihydrodipicolinate synthase/N-acetylneuraminate lyase
VVALDCALSQGNSNAAEQCDARIHEFLAWSAEFPSPLLVKVAAGVRGLKPGLPAMPLSPARQHRLDEFRRWFEGWLPTVKQ